MSDRPLTVLMRLPRYAGIAAVLVYQACLRPFLVGGCRHVPSCSQYAVEALSTHGLVRGVLLTVRRLLRCHPFARPGLDPVPPK